MIQAVIVKTAMETATEDKDVLSQTKTMEASCHFVTTEQPRLLRLVTAELLESN